MIIKYKEYLQHINEDYYDSDLDLERYHDYYEEFFGEDDYYDYDFESHYDDYQNENWSGWNYLDSFEYDDYKTDERIAYCGSKTPFKNFSYRYIGTGSGTGGAGIGFYFTNNPFEAASYGDNIYKCRLELKRGISNTSVTLTPQEILNILDVLQKHGDNYFENFYNESMESIIQQLIYTSGTDTGIVSSIAHACGNIDLVCMALSRMGINYTQNEENEDLHTIMYNPIDIQILDETTFQELKKQRDTKKEAQ